MIYLIDGHNLIGKMDNIELSDPDDEEKLVRRLQSWSSSVEKKQVMVVFDSGLFGGIVPHLSGYGVQVQYARRGQKADDVLIRFLKDLRNPQAYTLVTSDREIIAAAKRRRVGYITSEEFVILLQGVEAKRKEKKQGGKSQPAVNPDQVNLSEQEVNAWLNEFEQAAPRPRATPPPAPLTIKKEAEASQTPAAPPTPPTVDELKDGAEMPADDLKAWLALFGDVPQAAPAEKKGKRPGKNKTAGADKRNPQKLSNEDLEDWLRYFGQD